VEILSEDTIWEIIEENVTITPVLRSIILWVFEDWVHEGEGYSKI
jgi:hypothetical protein